jgi:hypothetical protein
VYVTGKPDVAVAVNDLLLAVINVSLKAPKEIDCGDLDAVGVGVGVGVRVGVGVGVGVGVRVGVGVGVRVGVGVGVAPTVKLMLSEKSKS